MSLNNAIATDPQRSVVVEACAGSGKTWLLSARIVRCLLAGVPPHAILALTFTRKAAAEMAQRVGARLRELADMPDEKAVAELQALGMNAAQALEGAVRRQQLYEQFLCADRAPTITTLDAWNQGLLAASPLPAARLKTLGLAARPWRTYKRRREAVVDRSTARQGSALAELVLMSGASAADAVLDQLGRRRSQRVLLQSPMASVLKDESFADLTQAQRLARAQFWLDQAETLGHLASEIPMAVAEADAPSSAAPIYTGLSQWQEGADPEDLWQSWLGVFCTAAKADCMDAVQSTHPPLRKSLGTQAFRSTLEKRGGLMTQLERFRDDLLRVESAQREAQHKLRERLVGALSLVWDEVLAQDEAAEDETDYAGIEAAALALVRSEGGAHPLSRMDLRYQQILLDEFQDTSPAQWAMIRSWLEAYSGQGIAQANHPKVFLVGDPKQSIYGFRGAELSIFESASRWLCKHYGATSLSTDLTRRCQAEVVNALNSLCPSLPGSHAYRPHTAQPQRPAILADPWRGVWRIPAPKEAEESPDALVDASIDAESESAGDTGNAAVTPPEGSESRSILPKALEEGRRIAKTIRRLREASEGALAFSDCRILLPVRTHIRSYEMALAEENIPFLTSRSSGLLAAPEVQDLLALARAVLMPGLEPMGNRLQGAPIWRAGESPGVLISQWSGAIGPLLAVLPAAEVFSELLRISGPERWEEAYRPQPADQTRANLEALIHLALQSEAGRLPGLLPCLQDFDERLREDGEASGAPGVLAESIDAVQIQSVHGAKGLESTVVFLAGLDQSGRSSGGLQLLECWGEGHETLLRLGVGSSSDPPALGGLLEAWQRRHRQGVEEAFNLAYVGLTRGRELVLLSGMLVPGAKSLGKLDKGGSDAPKGMRALWCRAHMGEAPMPVHPLLDGLFPETTSALGVSA